jgi:hypothetical protein
MARPNLNLLDKGALGFALARIDTNASEDEWAISGGKFFIAISITFHFIMFLGLVLDYDLPSRPIITVIGFAVAAVIYVPIRLLTHSASEIQQAKLSRRAKWLYRAWAVFILPGSMLLWIPLFFIL